MADLAQTPANVAPGAQARRLPSLSLAGEALDAGMPVYKRTSDGRYYKADCNTATAPEGAKLHPPEAEVTGITLNPAGPGQPVTIQTSGEINLGAVLVPGTTYCLSFAAGKICPQADLLAAQTPPHNLVVLGYAKTAAILKLKIDVTDVAL